MNRTYILYSTEFLERKWKYGMELSEEGIKELCMELFTAGDRRAGRTGLHFVVKGPGCRPSGTLIIMGFEESEEKPGLLRGFVKAGTTTYWTGNYSNMPDAWPRLWKTVQKAVTKYNFLIRKKAIVEKVLALDVDDSRLEKLEALFLSAE